MSIIDSLFDWLKPITKEDPIFGEMHFDSAGFWAAEVEFPPESCRIQLILDGDEDANMEKHRIFFKKIIGNWQATKNSFKRNLFHLLHTWDETTKEDKIWEYLALQGFWISSKEGPGKEWEINFEFANDGNHFIIIMEDDKFKGMRIDG